MKCEIVTGNMPQLWEDLLSQLHEKEYPSESIRHYREAMGRVDRYMRENQILEYTEAVGETYLATHGGRISSGRQFYMKYLYQEQIHPLNLAEFVPAVRRAKPMPTVYSKDEIQKLLNVVDKSTDKGLRDRAMLLLAARLGIRTSDICNLKKKNIHWDTNTIEFVQKKTGVSARLELLPDVRRCAVAVPPATDKLKEWLSNMGRVPNEK